MKLNKEKFKKFIEILNEYYSKMKDTDIIDTDKMSLVSNNISDDPNKFQIKVKNIGHAKELNKLRDSGWNPFNVDKGESFQVGFWYRNKHSDRVYSWYDWKKFPKTKVVDIEFIKEYVANKK
jgi:hypothetical protein